MGITVTTETLNAPVAHVALLKPGQSLGGAANRADCNTAVLTPRQTVYAVAGADLWVFSKGHTAGQADELQAIKDGAIAFVVDDNRAKLPAHLLTPVVADVLHQITDGARLRISDKPLVVYPDHIACPVLAEANQCGGQSKPDWLIQSLRC